MEGGFVPRAAARIRLARALFLGVCLVPSAGLVAWGWHLRGASHRQRVLGEASRAIGRRVTADRLAHPRPGVLELTGVRVGPPGATLEVESIRFERADREVRVSVPRWSGTLAAFRQGTDLLREWLDEPVRHPHDWVVDVGRIDVDPGAGPGRNLSADAVDAWTLAGARVECVATAETRAVRVRREPFDGDEIRVRRTASAHGEAPDPAGKGADADEGLSIEIELSRPVPLAWLCAAWGGPALESSAGKMGVASGTVSIEFGGSGSGGDGISGGGGFRVDAFDAGLVPRAIGSRAVLEGPARLEVDDVQIVNGRFTHATAVLQIGSGIVSQGLLGRWVEHLGCRAGEAYPIGTGLEPEAGISPRERARVGEAADAAEAGGPLRPFGLLNCRLVLRDGWFGIVSVENRPVILTASDGRMILAEPVAAVPVEQVAWAFASSGARPVPLVPFLEWIVPFTGGGRGGIGGVDGGN
jgi:hypothetical protein